MPVPQWCGTKLSKPSQRRNPVNYKLSSLFLHSRDDHVHLCDVLVRQFLELSGARVSVPHNI